MAEQKKDEEYKGPSFRVIYYPMGGRAEPIRYAAALGGIKFEDRFMADGQQGKEKAAGLRRWSGPPEIEILDKNGKVVTVIGQSNACLRYVGQLAGVYPKNQVLAALADEVTASVEDALGVMIRGRPGPDATEEEKGKAMEEMFKEGGSLRYWFDKFVCRIQEREKLGVKTGLCVTDEITTADLKLAALIRILVQRVPPAKKLLEEKYKPLIKVMETVDANEKIKAFEEQFKKNCAEFKKGFQYGDKTVTGSL